MTPVDVVGLGAATVDYLGLVPHFPEPDDKMAMREFVRQGGGLAATALVALARLGATTRYVGKLGEDDFSRFIRAEFEREGVATDALVLRTILHSGHGPAQLAPDELCREAVLSGRALLVDTSDPAAALTAAGWARDAGHPVVLDGDKYSLEARELAAAADYAIVSQRYAAAYTGLADPAAAAAALAQDVPGVVIVTAGRAGAYVDAGSESFHQPVFSVPVKDTTGAGDVFHGAFLYALLQDWNLRRCVTFAAAVAALKCRALGGRAGIPTLPEALVFLGWTP